ncbi:MAG TPA: c-type cytochrome [Roseiflexaceae bacterium]
MARHAAAGSGASPAQIDGQRCLFAQQQPLEHLVDRESQAKTGAARSREVGLQRVERPGRKRGGQASSPPGYKNNMPGFPGSLSDRQIWAVLAYIKSTWPADIRAVQEQVNRQAR